MPTISGRIGTTNGSRGSGLAAPTDFEGSKMTPPSNSSNLLYDGATLTKSSKTPSNLLRRGQSGGNFTPSRLRTQLQQPQQKPNI